MKNVKTYLLITVSILVGAVAGYWFGGSNNFHIKESDKAQISTSNDIQIWTCSMHPQIRQNEAGDCPLCGMDLIPLEVSSSNDPLVLEMTKEAVKLANIQTTIIGASETKDGIGQTIRLSGKIQTDERLASSQVAHVSGRIEKLFVSFTGEQVNKGQKIATIYSPELITAQRELLEALKLQDINPGLLEAARNKLRYLKIGKSTIDAIEKNGKIQENFTIYADEAGIITKRRVAVGDHLKQGEALFDLMNLSKVWVLFDVYEKDLGSVAIGNRIEFTTPSMPDKIFKTRITFIDRIINPNTRVASIRTEMTNSYGHLKPEMFVNGILKNNKTTKSKSNLTVPKSAVLWTGKRSVVYVKLPDTNIPSFKFREVEIGKSMDESYQIMSGLEAGEEVVTYGSFTIDAAAQLNNQTSMMNKNVLLKGFDLIQNSPDYTESTPIEFKEQLYKVSEAYFLTKDAFVETNNKKATNHAQQIVETLTKVDMTLLKNESHMFWMEQLKTLQAHSQKIIELNDVEEQRKQFDFLSQALINVIKVFGIPKDTLYVQHCPMANDNKGAAWLSSEKVIRNPYFGDLMLTCGMVQDTITIAFKNPGMKQADNASRNIHNH